MLSSLLHDIDEGVLMNLHFTNGSKFLFTLFVSLQELSLSTVISTIAFSGNVFLDVRNVFFRD